MPRKVHAPEEVVFLGPQLFEATIPDDAVIVLKPNYPKEFDAEDRHTPAERYAINHRGLLHELVEATYEAELPFDATDFAAVRHNNPEHWARCGRAATVILVNSGYFPPLYETSAVADGGEAQDSFGLLSPQAQEAEARHAALELAA